MTITELCENSVFMQADFQTFFNNRQGFCFILTFNFDKAATLNELH